MCFSGLRVTSPVQFLLTVTIFCRTSEFSFQELFVSAKSPLAWFHNCKKYIKFLGGYTGLILLLIPSTRVLFTQNCYYQRTWRDLAITPGSAFALDKQNLYLPRMSKPSNITRYGWSVNWLHTSHILSLFTFSVCTKCEIDKGIDTRIQPLLKNSLHPSPRAPSPSYALRTKRKSQRKEPPFSDDLKPPSHTGRGLSDFPTCSSAAAAVEGLLPFGLLITDPASRNFGTDSVNCAELGSGTQILEWCTD